MKRILIVTALCMTLCGCARGSGLPEHAAPTPTLPVGSALAVGAKPKWEDHGTLQLCPIPDRDIQGIRSDGQMVLLFSGSENTTLTVLSGPGPAVTGKLELSFLLEPDDPSLVFHDQSFSFYDPDSAQTLVLDAACRCLRRIPTPEPISGVQVLSFDQQALYYCTATALRAWDFSGGVRRTVKEMTGLKPTVAGCGWHGDVVACRVNRQTVLLDAQTGLQLSVQPPDFTLTDCDDRFYAAFTLGQVQSLVYGTSQETARTLLPEDYSGETFFLPHSHRAVAVSPTGEHTYTLSLYDLESGGKGATLSLTSSRRIAVTEGPGGIWLLLQNAGGGSTLCLWTPDAEETNFSGDYSAAYFPAGQPDDGQLAQCRELADRIGRKHGIHILIGEEAAAQEPWDYALEPEYRTLLLRRELEALDGWLSVYPEPILSVTASHFDRFAICLVRQLNGKADTGSLNAAAGVQFFQEDSSYLALAVGKYAQQTLYHELLHAMQTHLFTHSSALDRWEDLNPSSFSYDYNYATNAVRDSSIYLRKGERYFVDTYSMSFPKEDRARVMEYAMLPHNEALFASAPLQKKLQALCLAIREAYGLEDCEQTLLWEQYLEE